jgi:hypothetical protein
MTPESGLNRTLNHPAVSVPAENHDRWTLVLRVAATPQFTKAPRLRDILIYICQRALAEPSASIKEQEIGRNALGRKPDFNPHEDNIVRVQISHLRKKLDGYFATDGKDEKLRIVVPKGMYVPRFEPNTSPVMPNPVPSPAAVKRQPSSWIFILSVSTGLLTIICLYLALRPPVSRATSQTSAPPPAREDPFWRRVFGSAQPAAVVVADTCLVMFQDILHTDIPVADYLSRQYPEALLNKEPDRDLRSALQLIASRQYSSLADINIASRLVNLSHEFGGNGAAIRYARNLNIRDFKTGNFVLIGSRRGVPWVQLFEPELNFSFEENKTTHRFYFRNKAPKPGEQASYVPTENGGTADTYADIALLPNLGNTGTVLILSGISMESAEAAGELVGDKDFAKVLTRMIGPEAVSERYFEILLRTSAVGGTVKNSQIVTYRMVQPGAVTN